MVRAIIVSFFLALLAAISAHAAQNQLQQVTGNIGPNPTNVGMFVYKPNALAKPTPLIVAVHYCHGTAQSFFAGSQFATLADTYGYILIFPNSPNTADNCFDVSSNGTLSHNGGGDSEGIASMVNYAITNYGIDTNQIFVTGVSSGAMMTNVLAGSYPNLFKAASAFAGVPFGCFAGPTNDYWSSDCASGLITKTAQEWGDIVRNAYSGYTGHRPKMQLWHGTVDQTLNYTNFGEEIKEWTNVLGVSQTPSTSLSNTPISGYTKTTYGSVVEAYSAAGVDHNIPVREMDALTWFGITGTGVGTTTSSPRPTSTSISTSTTTTASSSAATQYGQCGGQGWTGPQSCLSPFNCVVLNPYYSQCL